MALLSRRHDDVFDLKLGERLPYKAEWATWLADQDDVRGPVTWVVPDGLTKTSESYNDELEYAYVWLEGTTAPKDYLVTGTMVTPAGRRKVWTVQVRVRAVG